MENRNHQLLKRISTNPQIFEGKPIIRGMRFKVTDILDYLASGMTASEILSDFPYLESEDIEASLLYASKKINHTILSVKLNEA